MNGSSWNWSKRLHNKRNLSHHRRVESIIEYETGFSVEESGGLVALFVHVVLVVNIQQKLQQLHKIAENICMKSEKRWKWNILCNFLVLTTTPTSLERST
jgi:hypothetical protein